MRLARKAALRQPFVAGLSSSAPGLFIKLQSPAERSMKKRRRMGEASLPVQSLLLQRLAAGKEAQEAKMLQYASKGNPLPLALGQAADPHPAGQIASMLSLYG